WLEWLVIAVFTVWIANRCAGPPLNGDSGVYHFSAVQLASRFPVLPGVALLHPFLGVSHGFFLFAAFIDAGPWEGYHAHLANGLLTLTLAVPAVLAIGTFLRTRTAEAITIFDFTLLVLAIQLAVGRDLSSPTSDTAEIALSVAVAREWVVTVGSRQAPRLVLLALLSGALIAVKLSSAFAAGWIVANVALLIWREPHARRAIGIAAAVLAAAVVPWMASNVVRTGWLPYPGCVVAFPVEWRIPQSLCRAVSAYTVSYGRLTLHRWDEPPDWSWVGPWFEQLLAGGQALWPLALFTAATTAAAVHLLRGRKLAVPFWLTVPVVAQLLFWFFTAPDERYAGGWFWLLVATAFASIATSLHRLAPVVALGVVLLSASMELKGGLQLVGTAGLAPPPAATLQEFVSDNGVQLDFAPDGKCWNAKQPCTGMPEPAIALRRVGDLSAGFVWRPKDEEQVPVFVQHLEQPHR
ncbi:MAG: hypothetical protein M3Q75_11450, partial [Gemmatimonadota bacterium]|nr:hypothetical protein [Gemmatimonadota bacterium]